MKVAFRWDAAVRQRTAGRVRLRFRTATEADDERDIVRLLNLGQYQGAFMTGVGIGLLQPDMRVLELPFFIRTDAELDHVRKVLDSFFRQRLAARGYVLLAWADHGWIYAFGKKPLRSKEEFSRGRVFLWADDPLARKTLELLGCATVPLGFREVNTALATGRIEWLYGTPLEVLLFGWNRRLKFMNDFPFLPGTGALVLQQAALEKLAPADRQALLETALQTQERILKQVRADNATALVELRKQGLGLVRNGDVLGAQFPPIAQKVWAELAGSFISREAFREVQRVLADYRRGKR